MAPKESKTMAELESLLVFKTHDEVVELSKELKRLSKTKRMKSKIINIIENLFEYFVYMFLVFYVMAVLYFINEQRKIIKRYDNMIKTELTINQ